MKGKKEKDERQGIRLLHHLHSVIHLDLSSVVIKIRPNSWAFYLRFTICKFNILYIVLRSIKKRKLFSGHKNGSNYRIPDELPTFFLWKI